MLSVNAMQSSKLFKFHVLSTSGVFILSQKPGVR